MKGFSWVDVEVQEGDCRDGLRLISGTVTSANILGFKVGTTGYRGGDSGHGGRTFFSIFDRLSSDMLATTDCNGGELSVELGGDSELETIIVALRAIALILEASASNGTECTSAEQIRELMKDDGKDFLEQRKVEALENIAKSLRLKVL